MHTNAIYIIRKSESLPLIYLFTKLRTITFSSSYSTLKQKDHSCLQCIYEYICGFSYCSFFVLHQHNQKRKRVFHISIRKTMSAVDFARQRKVSLARCRNHHYRNRRLMYLPSKILVFIVSPRRVAVARTGEFPNISFYI